MDLNSDNYNILVALNSVDFSDTNVNSSESISNALYMSDTDTASSVSSDFVPKLIPFNENNEASSLISNESLSTNSSNSSNFRESSSKSVSLFEILANSSRGVEITANFAYSRDYEGHPISAKGKLWDKYINKRRLYRKIGILEKNARKKDLSDQSSTTEDDIEVNIEEIQWLKNNVHPWTKVLDIWRKTSKYRVSKFTDTVHKYMNSFPCLKQPFGYTLFDIDFETNFGESTNKLFNNWPTLAQKVLRYAEKKKDNCVKTFLSSFKYQTAHEDIQAIFALLVLPLLFPPYTSKRKSDVSVWRPSRFEAQQGFILHVKTIRDLEPELQARSEKILKFKLTEQPIPIFVGELDHIEAAFLLINNHKYPIETALKAFDVCFKCFQVLGAKYPYEAEHVWTFVQQNVYNIRSEFDKNFLSSKVLMTDLNKIN